MAPDEVGFISASGEGKLHQALGVAVRTKASNADTYGRFEIIEVEFPQGTGFPPHIHNASDEAFYVLQGELNCQVGDKSVSLSAGSFAFAAKGLVHSFANAGSGTARVLAWLAPGSGMEGMMEELSRLPAGEPDMNKIGEILHRYDTDVAAPPGS